MLHFDGRARLETTAPGDLPRRFSRAVRLFGRSATLEGDAGVLPRYSAHSKSTALRGGRAHLLAISKTGSGTYGGAPADKIV